METLEYVKRASEGDTEAFGLLYEEFADRLYRYIEIRISEKQYAEDLLQEVFIKAWQALPNLNLTNLNFTAWLYKIAHNCIIDHFRKIHRRPETVELIEGFDRASTESLEHTLSLQKDLAVLRQSIQQLPPNFRQILELRFVQDFTIAETAQILKKSNLAVRLSQFRALKKLQDILKL